jgi:osmotically-inducible protein OsmY
MSRLSILMASVLCALPGLPVAAATPPVRTGPRASDSEIEATIRTKLAKSKIGKDGIQVHVHNGVATWTGTTSVMQHKGAATRMAKTAGAIQVINNIKISDEAKLRAFGNTTGEPRRAQVKAP